MKSRAGCARFETSDFSALTDSAVVEHREVSDFTGESGFAVGKLAVEHHSHSKTPAEVDENHIFLVVRLSADILAIGHCS